MATRPLISHVVATRARTSARISSLFLTHVTTSLPMHLADIPVESRNPPLKYSSIISRSMVTIIKTEAGSIPKQQVVVTSSSTSNSGEKLSESVSSEGVIITASCAQQINRLAAKRPDGGKDLYLRLYVDAGGCSGFEYKFELQADTPKESVESPTTDGADSDDEIEGIDPEDDIVFTKEGARVVIDRASLELLRGSTVDFVQEMIRSSFAVVNNPNSESACGCGSSFAVKNFETNPALD